MKITEILKGCEPGKIQSVGYMQIVPLISKFVDESIMPPNIKVSTTDYGRLVLNNESVDNVLVPTASAFMSKQKAQDHATHSGAYLTKKGSNAKTNIVKINTAACIQDNQCGKISNDEDFHFSILPWSMREQAFNVKDQTCYDKLWPVLRQFNRNLGIIDNEGYLISFINKFEDDMNQFIAEFEIVPNMVGAIILINGMVIGVERCPNYNYFKFMWEPLIRESYGGAVFQYIAQTKEVKKRPKPITRVPMSDSQIRTLDDLEKEFDRVTSEEDKIVTQIIHSFLKNTFQKSSDQKTPHTELWSVQNQQFTGQVFQKDNAYIYTSLVTRQDFMKNPQANIRNAAPDWDDAKEFSM